MRKATTALFVVLLFVFSCTKESVSPDLDAGNDVLKKADAAKKVTKTIKFHESTGIILETPVPCEICDLCTAGAIILIQGSGHASHLGAFTVINYYCLNEFPSPPLRGMLTAANGDHINTMVIGISNEGVYHYQILGGDGRFEGASGDIYMWGDINYVEGTFDLVGEGEITY